MTILDIETVMDDIATLAVSADGIPAELTAINTEKGDSLLDISNFSNRYFTWLFYNNSYQVSFIQSLDDDPQVLSIREGTTLIYPITIAIVINDDGTTNMPILQVRYNRAVRQFLLNTLVQNTRYTTLEITKQRSLYPIDQEGNSYVIGEVTFTVSLVS